MKIGCNSGGVSGATSTWGGLYVWSMLNGRPGFESALALDGGVEGEGEESLERASSFWRELIGAAVSMFEGVRLCEADGDGLGLVGESGVPGLAPPHCDMNERTASTSVERQLRKENAPRKGIEFQERGQRQHERSIPPAVWVSYLFQTYRDCEAWLPLSFLVAASCVLILHALSKRPRKSERVFWKPPGTLGGGVTPERLSINENLQCMCKSERARPNECVKS